MDADALLTAPRPIPVHALAAMAAIVPGGVRPARPKDTPSHRGLAHVRVGARADVAGSDPFIHMFGVVGPFSPIHLLSPLTLVLAVAVRRGPVRARRAATIQPNRLALVLRGAFTLLPGRVMHRVLFG